MLPIVAFIRAARRSADLFSPVLLAAMGIYAIGIVSIPVSSSVRELAMRRFHLSGWSFAAWALSQPVPSMYNFENEWEVRFEPTGEPGCEPHHEHVNHQLFGRFSAAHERYRFSRCGPAVATLKSSYRGTIVETRFTVTKNAGGRGLVVRRLQ